jgi:hypothetical protein
METKTKASTQNQPTLHRRFQDSLWGQPPKAEHELKELVDLIIEVALEKGKAGEITNRDLAQRGAR